MFNIGDLVTIRKEAPYFYTNEYALCVVTKIHDFRDITVAILEGSILSSGPQPDEEEMRHIDSTLDTQKSDGRINMYDINSNYCVHIDSFEAWEEIKRVKGFETIRSPYYEAICNHFNLKGDTTMNNATATTATTEIEAPSAIDLTGKYNFTEQQEEYVPSKMKELYDEYDHINSAEGIEMQWNEHKENKSPVLAFLSNHPKFDPEAMAIVLEGSYERKRDAKAIEHFCEWCRNAILNWGRERQYKYYCCTTNELEAAKDRLVTICSRVEDIMYTTKGSFLNVVTVNGMTYKELMKEKQRLYSLWKYAYEHSIYTNGIFLRQDNDDYIKFCNAYSFISMIESYKDNIADEEFARKANEWAEPFDFEKNGKTIGLGAVKGKKVSRIVQDFFKNYGLNKIVDKRDEVFYDDNGNFHTRTKDHGWNSQYGKYTDAVNPLTIKRWTIISANFLDYLTMSFGNGWQSCHTIDKTNKRGIDSAHNYSGMYCSGTLSYALDGNSIIMYTVDEKYKGKEFWSQPKINRCMFHIGEDKIVQGRLYPDGRDGGDDSLSAQFRNIMQKVIADCAKEANLWKLVKGTDACDRVVNSYGTHYKDYLHYEDCTVSYLKRNGIKKNTKMIPVGHRPICPCCGEEHYTEDQLTCPDCRENRTCYHCGSVINEDDRIYDEDSDHYFCCEECANEYGAYYCENVEAYHSDYVYYDNWTEEYFYDYGGYDCIHFEYRGEEYHYLNEENAELDGFHFVDGNYYHEDDGDIVQCTDCGDWILFEDAVKVNGDYYCEGCAPEEEAEEEIA